ncbi:iron ABC transporter substrate-binding protein [Acidisoma cellulosilytica]|uniref:Iron ABC transporter substrate-binding protein n=1 Tax=Acidisoma cellulosilyticum TaxID=2802395 RepID=A0A963Z6E7_9PROT|nr:iron ABC transporter substrate-binding protein [Acidisoma cellulosilyticum]MCB8883645.1 iron ABC transporter substrate-binding protein [Acidisoma cellulosilyticum]
MTHLNFRRRGLAFGLSGAIMALAAPTLSYAADPEVLTLYSAQHEQVIDMLTAAFTKQTGIKVLSHAGEGPDIAHQLVQEGSASAADIFLTENSPELVLLDEKKLLAPVDPKTLAAVPPQDSPSSGHWVGVLARENVLTFNPKLIAETELPASLLDLADPKWKGKIAIAPSDSDFLPLVSAVLVLKGQEATLAWLKGLKANAQVFDDDEGVVAAVDRGAAATGIINSYYWARLATEQGMAKTQAQVYHFDNGDAGALVNISGAAILASSKNKDAAQKFLAFLVSKPTQSMLAASDVDFEYPLAAGVPVNAMMKPRSELHPPVISLEALGDDQPAAALLREAGLI